MKEKQKVLIVDDDSITRIMTSKVLSNDFLVDTAGSAHEALHKASEFRPSVILLDIQLGDDITGFDVCEKIKSRSEFNDARIIFVSARDAIEDKIHSYEVGGEGYIVKPFSPYEIKAKILNVASRIRQEKKYTINPAVIIRTDDILPAWKKSMFASLNRPPVSN